MRINKRKISMTVLLLIFTVLSAALLWYRYHPTYWKYCDSWVIGRSIEAVSEKYGGFDIITDTYAAYSYVDNSGLLPEHVKHYYCMYYNADRIVYKIADKRDPAG